MGPTLRSTSFHSQSGISYEGMVNMTSYWPFLGNCNNMILDLPYNKGFTWIYHIVTHDKVYITRVEAGIS